MYIYVCSIYMKLIVSCCLRNTLQLNEVPTIKFTQIQ